MLSHERICSFVFILKEGILNSLVYIYEKQNEAVEKGCRWSAVQTGIYISIGPVPLKTDKYKEDSLQSILWAIKGETWSCFRDLKIIRETLF